ncbi:hypothetical protein EMIHUDRAFT_115708 [Emiliania huxleyi CCMP1516]|uniref:Methyltransferase FkbM domain-containing protein n=2 Tax=Emiliania huxleyi TaxID=2903 RepID=A0A0D3JN27_EMIH1|nr:hypothetical protein EMIHUDRAFT_115708 [Emiliania huxleyi CCMP1516]EOD24912.1 hypothetical protein EMIHUDRAFT_115708 [Emiliania huxleyi CCMP1516]|eukprot:XP_005777341.1 hypothetical protein EMIHUDRAFT_115708 [Emiliania huxleyi CCMP1516]
MKARYGAELAKNLLQMLEGHDALLALTKIACEPTPDQAAMDDVAYRHGLAGATQLWTFAPRPFVTSPPPPPQRAHAWQSADESSWTNIWNVILAAGTWYIKKHGNLGKFSTAKLEALGWDAKQICRTCVNWQTPMGRELQKRVMRRAKNGVTGADGEDLPTTSHWQGYTGSGAEQLLRRLYCKHVSNFSAGKRSASRLSELGRVKCKLPVSQAPPDVGSRLPDGQLYSCLGLYRSLFMGRVAIGTLYRIDGTSTKEARASTATLALIALVVGPARAVQPQRMITHEGLLPGELSALPPWLSALGVSLVGHRKAQHMVRGMSKVTAISTLGVTVNVTALAKDDTIGRLQDEFANRRDAWGRDCGECDDYGIRHLTSPTPLVLDVGGNIGFISSLIAHVHPKSQVIAFEPSPVTYFILRINLWLNGVHVLTSEELQGRPKIGGVYPVFGGLGASRAPFEWVKVSGGALAKSQNVMTRFGKSGDVPAYHWDSFMELHGLTSRTFDLVKLDCECCEYRLVPQGSRSQEETRKQPGAWHIAVAVAVAVTLSDIARWGFLLVC